MIKLYSPLKNSGYFFKLLIISISLLTMISTVASLSHDDWTKLGDKIIIWPHSNPGPATDTINFSAYAVEIAPKEIEAGDLDLYIFSLKTPAAEKLRDKDGIDVHQAPASMVSIVLNPAPAPEGSLNPLSIIEVRQAIQHVVNRPFVSQEIYKGFALPMLTQVSPADFDLLTVYESLKTSNIYYDPDLAKSIVSNAMTSAGAELQNGYWHYGENRLDLKFIVRTEDERWEIGNALRTELNRLGFNVVLIPQQFGPAVFTVYSTDPQLFQWHLYTEGWGRGSPERYDFASVNQMCAPWLGNMPGWQEIGFWQYKQDELDKLGQRIFTGEFQNVEERNEIYKQATEKCLEESVRIWVATAVNNFPSSSELVGITQDLVSGPKNLWTFRDMHIPGRSELNIGNLWVSTNQTTWNPVGGFGDVYSADIWKSINDPPLTNHPFTGLPIPFRATYEVESAGPSGKLDIPGDAFEWNASAGTWKYIEPGTNAISKVVFDYSKYFQSKWHHEEPINMADVIYPIARLFDMVYNEDKSNIEFSIATTSRPFTDTVRGFRIIDETRLEVYVDFWHFIPDYIAQYANISGVSMPWEVNAAMDDIVFNQMKASYSDTSATRFNNTWLDLVSSKDARMVRNTLRQFAETETVITNVFNIESKPLVNIDSPSTRYQAAINWFAQKDHMVISNGPYYLEKFRGGGEQFAQIKAFRDPSYPFKPGNLYKGTPQTINFDDISNTSAEIGKDIKTKVEINGPGRVSLDYLLVNPSIGTIVHSGRYPYQDKGDFEITIPGDISIDLDASTYHLFLVAASDELAKVVERKIDIDLVSDNDKSRSTKSADLRISQEPSKDENSGVSLNLILGLVIGSAVIIAFGLIILVLRSRTKNS